MIQRTKLVVSVIAAAGAAIVALVPVTALAWPQVCGGNPPPPTPLPESCGNQSGGTDYEYGTYESGGASCQVITAKRYLCIVHVKFFINCTSITFCSDGYTDTFDCFGL